MAFALLRVKDDVIRKTEHEFNAKTSLNSTPANFRDNTATNVTTVNREIAKLPKAQRVKIVADSASQQLQNSKTAEAVAKVHNGNFKKKPYEPKKKAENEQSSDKTSKKKKFDKPCPYCQIRCGKLFYHPIDECNQRQKNKDLILAKVNKDLEKQEVKTIKSNEYYSRSHTEDYDVLGSFNT